MYNAATGVPPSVWIAGLIELGKSNLRVVESTERSPLHPGCVQALHDNGDFRNL